MPKVFISVVGQAYIDMFESQGWEVVDTVDKADLVQFTGGADVNPSLYGELPHAQTYEDPHRDEYDINIYRMAIKAGKPMAGICRGGQFLHVMNGCDMWQHIPGHAMHGTHKAFPYNESFHIEVTSTHHQAMRNGDKGEVLLWAKAHGYHEHMDEHGELLRVLCNNSVEAVYHRDNKCFCFQPHPEFHGVEACRNYYFGKLKDLFGLGV